MKVNAKVRYKLQRLIKNLHEASGNTWTSQPREAYADVYYSVDEALDLVTKCAPCDSKSATDIRDFLDRASELQARSPEGEDQELYRLADLSSQFVDVVREYNDVLNELMMGLDNYKAALNPMMGEARRRSKKELTRRYKDKEYRASQGSLVSLEKSGGSKKAAVGSGAFDWAEEPYAAARAAEIVSTGGARATVGKKKKSVRGK